MKQSEKQENEQCMAGSDLTKLKGDGKGVYTNKPRMANIKFY